MQPRRIAAAPVIPRGGLIIIRGSRILNGGGKYLQLRNYNNWGEFLKHTMLSSNILERIRPSAQAGATRRLRMLSFAADDAPYREIASPLTLYIMPTGRWNAVNQA